MLESWNKIFKDISKTSFQLTKSKYEVIILVFLRENGTITFSQH